MNSRSNNSPDHFHVLIMAVYLLLLLIVCCCGMKFSSFHQDYMSISATTAIKGIFAIIILLSHLRQYIVLGPGIPDRAFGFTMRYLEQLMVAAYFFYSGFGIAESAKRKEGYVQGFFKKRFLKTLLHFDLAVLLFLLVQTWLGNHFETRRYILCWIAWEDLGNSAWFIFAILALYLISYATLLVKDRFARPQLFLACSVSALTVGLWLFLFLTKRPAYWWYDTLAVFPAGIWYSLLKERVDKLTIQARIGLAALLVIGFLLWRHLIGIDRYGACAILFILALTAVTTFVKCDNIVLQWLGKHCFSIYILQRLPMIVLDRTSLGNQPIVFTAITLVCALLLAWAFTAMTDRIDKRVFA